MIRPALSSLFSTSKATPQFPYQFGGLPSSQFFHSEACQSFQHQMMSPEIDSVYINLYKKYLQALQQKNLKYLQDNVEGKLLQGIQVNFSNSNFNVKLVNPDAEIAMGVERNFMVGNLGFDRGEHGSEMRKRKVPVKYEHGLDFFEGFSLGDEKKYDLISLFSTRIYFKSAIKLIKLNTRQPQKQKQKQNSKQNKNEQIHSVQFEVQTKTTKNKLALKYFIKRILNFRNKQKYGQEMMKILIGASPGSIWKIADVDKVLHGNLPKPVQQFSAPTNNQQLKP